MTPSTSEINLTNYEIQPSLTYKLDLDNKRIIGKTNNSDAVLQAVEKILSTDKYAYDIYDWNYGNEILKLVGKEFNYIKVKLPQIIEEALLQDDRIKEITDLVIEQKSIDTVFVSFNVVSIFSTINYTMEVNVL